MRVFTIPDRPAIALGTGGRGRDEQTLADGEDKMESHDVFPRFAPDRSRARTASIRGHDPQGNANRFGANSGRPLPLAPEVLDAPRLIHLQE